MIIIIGLVILIAALVVGVAGVLSNGGSAYPLVHWSVLGYHLQGSAGTLFVSGIVVGAVGLLGLTVLLAGARRTSRRGREARLQARRSRRDAATAARAREDFLEQEANARADASTPLGNGAIDGHGDVKFVTAEPPAFTASARNGSRP